MSSNVLAEVVRCVPCWYRTSLSVIIACNVISATLWLTEQGHPSRALARRYTARCETVCQGHTKIQLLKIEVGKKTA